MRTRTVLIAALLLAGCVEGGGPRHHGGRMGMGAGMPNFEPAAHQVRTPGTADADAILFASFDRDGDLLVSPAELEAGIAREFARADANHDHVIDPTEYQAWSVRGLGGVYAPFRLDIDRNADGQITWEEFSAEFHARAHRYDGNNDGVIEHADLVRAAVAVDDDLQLLTPQSGAQGGDMPDGGPPHRRR